MHTKSPVNGMFTGLFIWTYRRRSVSRCPPLTATRWERDSTMIEIPVASLDMSREATGISIMVLSRSHLVAVRGGHLDTDRRRYVQMKSPVNMPFTGLFVCISERQTARGWG